MADSLIEHGAFVAALGMILSWFLNHLRRMEDRHDQRVAAFIGAMETVVAKYGSVVRMVVTKDAKCERDETTP